MKKIPIRIVMRPDAPPATADTHRIDPATVSEALVRWIGFGRASWPRPDDDAVRSAYGSEMSEGLLRTLRALHADFYSSHGLDTVRDLVAMGEQAAAEFSERHPEITEPAVQALTWAYTYDYR